MLLDTHISMPNQDPLAENKFSLLPRDLRKWIKNLPYVDQDMAIKQFYDGLKRSNRQAHSTKQRLAAIEIMRPVAYDFLKQQRKYLLAQPFPLSKKATEVLKLQQNILNELAVAYKIIIQETINRDSHLSNKKLVMCVHYAMYYQLEQYITLAQVYSEPPQSYWNDLCQLYGIAEHFDLTEIPLKNTIDDEHTKSTPRAIFTHACLLSLANLHTYGHGEAEKISAHLDKSIQLASLSDNYSEEDEYTFYINLALRKPVRLIPEEEVPISSKNRYINATALINELKEYCKTENDNAHKPEGLSISLANRLLKKLSSKPIRASKRAVPPKGRLHIVIGLRDALGILYSGNVYTEDESEQIKNSNLELMPIENQQNTRFTNLNSHEDENNYEVSSANAWDWISKGNVITDKNAETNIPEDQKPSEPKARNKNVSLNPVIQTWDISNASKGGYCLTSSNTSDYQSQVGDIILLRLEDKTNDKWRLGVIRWMQSLTEQGVKMGIEILHGSLDVLNVLDSHHDYENHVDFEQVLLITEESKHGTQKSIITPPYAASSGDGLVLRNGNKTQNIVLQGLVEKTISFNRFVFSEMPSMPGGDEMKHDG